MTEESIRQQFFDQVSRSWMADEIFDAISDCVFFVKDTGGRYVVVNQTLVERCGRKTKGELIGRTAADLFPQHLGDYFSEQDFKVIENGRPIRAQLEMHLYPNGREGWCMTWKEPVISDEGGIIGVSGISRDLPSHSDVSGELEAIATILRYVDSHLDEAMTVKGLAELAELSNYQLDQRIRALFGISASQYVTRRRIERACHLLERSDDSLSSIAFDCGFSDQSTFTRQFKRSLGMPPGAYRIKKSNR